MASHRPIFEVKRFLKAFTQENAFGLASAQNLVCCCSDTTSFSKLVSEKKEKQKKLAFFNVRSDM